MSRCNLQYRCRKYWHSAMNHGLSLTIVTAYDMYKECASGSLCTEWKVEQQMTFHEFRDRLSSQMLKYKTRYGWYPGDQAFRTSTALNKKERKKTLVVPNKRSRNTATSVSSGGQHSVLPEELQDAKKTKRLCGSFQGNLSEHLKSFLEKGIKRGAKCDWCGEKTFTKCNICDIPLHNFPTRGQHVGYSCSVDWHNAANFGLGYKDAKELKSKQGVMWCMPSKAAASANQEHIDNISASL